VPDLAVRDPADIIEAVVLQGDLARLQPAQRVAYYRQTCDSLGLNPLTKPFDYINLNGKTVLYTTKSATDQLREIHGVSITRLEFKTVGDIYCTTAYAQDKTGRTDSSTGAVAITGLRGEALANAMMKSETKAKRRVTLSICGLGWTDESELGTIPGAQPVEVDADTGEFVPLRDRDQEDEDRGPSSRKGKLLERYGVVLSAARNAGLIKDIRDWILPSKASEAYISAKGTALKELLAQANASGDNQSPRLVAGEASTPPPHPPKVTVRSVLGQQLATLVQEASRLDVPFDDCKVELPADEDQVVRAIGRLQDRIQDKKDQLAGLAEVEADAEPQEALI
jgi:hypothetical protein